MARTKERKKIVHKPSTQEILSCISSVPAYAKILLEPSLGKEYVDFLEWLIYEDFYATKPDKMTIKKIAGDFKIASSKVTKWIHQIYHDIFELNELKPELFQSKGIDVTMYMTNYDNSCSFYMSLPVLPREFETIRIFFIKAKTGTDYFWVKNIEYTVGDDKAEITLSLQGGILNKYREFALDKALFQGRIHFMEVYDKHIFELDEELRRIFKS